MNLLRSLFLRLLLFLALAAGVHFQVAEAASIPAPNPMDILCNGVKIGTLNITNYATYANGGSVGATIEALFTKTDPTMDYNLKWIQAITDGKGTIGQANGTNPPYLDPYDLGPGGQREDNLPWYWTDPENMTAGVGVNDGNGPGSRFSDTPSQSNANSGNFIKFETALVSVDGLNIHYLKGFTWGYTVNADMTSTLDPFAWLNTPTDNLTGPTTAWDGTLNPKGGGKPVGYQFVGGACPCTTIPEPGLLGLTLVGLAGFAIRARARRC